jgi:secreted PhoX family phosphatase
MTPSAKLGTRLAAAAIIVAASTLATASVASDASGAARVTVVSGAGQPALTGDGGPAARATLASPAGVAVDAAGVAIADTGNCRVRFVPNADGKGFGITMRKADIYTIAGSKCGASERSGPAISAELSFPAGVAFDTAGNLYIADTGNNAIRKVSAATGVMSTIAAGELNGPSGIAVDPVGDLFIADTNNCRIREVSASGAITTVAGNGSCGDAGDNGPASSAELLTPSDVAVDAHGNLIIADTGNRRVREVAAAAGTNLGIAMSAGNIYTVAGSGSYSVYFGDGLPAASDAVSLNFPTGVAVDAAGNLFVADAYGRAVREVPAVSGPSFGIDTQAGAAYTVAGAGPAESPTAGGTAHDGVVYPSKLAIDATGRVIVADTGNNTVEMLAPR